MDRKTRLGCGLCFICEVWTMNKIKVGFSTSCVSKDEIIALLSKRFNVEVLDKNYDYFFCMEGIYNSKDNFLELISQKPEVIRIFYCGEAVYCDLNLFDYAVCFDEFNKDRILKFPHKLFYSWLDDETSIDKIKSNIDAKDILKEKTKFCNFIYSNALAHPMRDKLFYALSKYKKVDALGTHLKNVEIKNTRYDSNWEKMSVELKKPYKFSIAAENAQFKGYTSEKIITSMLANTIPIYFGDPDVAKLFNSKSFINVSDYACLEDVVKRVKEIDTNDDLYLEMISQPWRSKEQAENCEKEYQEHLQKFYHIFEQDFEKAHRRPQGCWPDFIYSAFFQSLFNDKFLNNRDSFLQYILSIDMGGGGRKILNSLRKYFLLRTTPINNIKT